MYLSILILPFISFLSTNIFGRFIGIFGSCILSTLLIFLSFLFSILSFFEVCISNSPCHIALFPWFHTELLTILWGFYFDSITVTMLLVVTVVSFIAHFYSISYMLGDPHQGRFMGYLSLFTGFMLLLVSSENFMVMFLGWEGIGLASFLLIGFWNNRIQAGKSAIKAMLVNRLGDLGLALGLCTIFLTFKSVDYFVVFSLVPKIVNYKLHLMSQSIDTLTLISFLLFWGALGKSAQIGLHIWLPDAMEGPTPVSALIHAATLVTAGVFLIIRCCVIFENSLILPIIAILGALTALFAASVGLVQYDMKRVIAYSTCSQLGYMVFSIGLSHYSLALFHLANHALFKALLFLSAGCIIHGISDEQDMRRLGGVAKIFPLSYTYILIGSLSLMGFPFLTGFYSKDVILEIALAKNTSLGNFSNFFGCLAAFCTSFYSFRLIYLIFINPTRSFKNYIRNSHEGSIILTLPLSLLALGAIFWGYLSKDIFIGFGTTFFDNGITHNFYDFNLVEAELLPSSYRNIPFLLTITGVITATILVKSEVISPRITYNIKTSKYFRKIFTILIQKWHFDQLTNELLVVKAMNWGYKCSFLLIDKGLLETFGPSGTTFNLQLLSKNFTGFQSGFVSSYALTILLALLLTLTSIIIPLGIFWGYLPVILFSYWIFSCI